MNLDKSIQMLRVFSAFSIEDSAKKPQISIFYNEGEGYTLRIKSHLVNAEYRDNLEKISEHLKLGIRELDGYLVIYGHF
jgi:hypothetical protein